jgi:hypothetical protein
MYMTAKSSILLLISCIAAIASVGCIFELSSGMPQLGQTNTAIILAASVPVTIASFVLAVMDARANIK